jgi:AcrR family transcriptional regulator
VSRATFYQHFADKEECLLAAYDQYTDTLLAPLASLASGGESSVDEFVLNVLTSFIAVIQQDVTAARAFFVELDAAGPRARARRRVEREAFLALFAQRHDEFRRHDPSLGPLPELAFEAIIDAAQEIVRDRLDSDRASTLVDLVPDMTLSFLAMIHGAARVNSD